MNSLLGSETGKHFILFLIPCGRCYNFIFMWDAPFEVFHSTPVESGLTQSALNWCTVRPLTESDDTRCCNNTIWPPEDEHGIARNMSRIVM
jgi:hypothetical protein